MNSRYNFALLFLSLVLISGCANQVIEFRDGALPEPTIYRTGYADLINWGRIFFGEATIFDWGGDGDSTADWDGKTLTTYVARVCKGAEKVARVETQISAWNIWLRLLSFGLYQPRQVKVYCTHNAGEAL